MNAATQPAQGAALAERRAHKDWELFWRIIAGLMLVVVTWVVWVIYQIMPRSVVTPMAYATQTRPIRIQQSPSSAPAPAAVAMPAPVAAPSTADEKSAHVPAATTESKSPQVNTDGLRLATEIAAPPAAKPAGAQEGNAVKVITVAPQTAGKVRP